MATASHPHPAAPAASGAAGDPLPAALAWLCAHHARPRSAASLLDGLPLASPLDAGGALRVLQEAGFRAAVLERPLEALPALLLPAVLFLQGREVCIALARHADGSFEVVFPGVDDTPRPIDPARLAERYAGHALVATPLTRTAAGTAGESGADALADPARHWLWSNLRRFAPYYRSALLAALLSNVLMLAGGLVTSVVFDKVIPHQSFVTLWTITAGAAIALVFDMAARQLRSRLIDQAGKKADLLIGARLFRQTLAVRMEHRPASAGTHAHTLAQVELVRDFFTSATLAALTDLPFVLLFVLMIFVIGGPLGWVMVAAVPAVLGTAWLMQASLRRSMRNNMAHQAELQGVLVEAVEGLEDLKAAGAQGRFLRRFEEATAGAAESALRARSVSSWASNLTSAAQQVVTLAMLVWGVYLIEAGTLTGGALIGAVMFAGRAIGPLGSVVGLATRYQGARAAMAALDRLMALPVERPAERVYVPNHRVEGHLALQAVGFAYPPSGPHPAPRVLADVTLRIAPGERVAILGRIGSGKSTVLRLLAGLYEPTAGRVEVDGLDLRQIEPADFRAAVGFVSQEPRLFAGSLRENVVMGRPEVDAACLTEAARLTGLDRLVAAHPQGWELPVGEMGSLLSGGQRQLVALARCLATQPRILLMDEPTSSMDAQSELLFLRRLKEAVGPRSLVAVTHRPAVLELVDRIVVMEEGRVLLDGPKARVLAALNASRQMAPAARSAEPAAAAPAARSAEVAAAAPASPLAVEVATASLGALRAAGMATPAPAITEALSPAAVAPCAAPATGAASNATAIAPVPVAALQVVPSPVSAADAPAALAVAG